MYSSTEVTSAIRYAFSQSRLKRAEISFTEKEDQLKILVVLRGYAIYIMSSVVALESAKNLASACQYLVGKAVEKFEENDRTQQLLEKEQ